MKICMVCPFFRSNSSVMKLRPDVFEVSRRLVKRGHKVVVLASKAYGAPHREVIDNVEVYRVSSLTLPNIFYSVPFFPSLIKDILGICREYNIEIIHFWNYEYLASMLAVFLRGKLKSTSFVLTVIGFPGLNWHYGLKIVDAMGRIYTYTIGRLILKSMGHVILLGKSLVGHALWMGVPKRKISVNSFAIDSEEFYPRKHPDNVRKEFNFSPSDIVLICVGRLEPVKGVIFLVKAVKHLGQNVKNLKLLIVGDGSIRSRLQKFDSDKIIFTGWRNDIADLLNMADIFILPSLSEGLPMSLLEAHALAKPLIATKVGAVPDLVIDHETGLLVKPKKQKQLEEAIHYLIDNKDAACQMGINGKEHIEKYYNWDQILKKYEEIYSSLKN